MEKDRFDHRHGYANETSRLAEILLRCLDKYDAQTMKIVGVKEKKTENIQNIKNKMA